MKPENKRIKDLAKNLVSEIYINWKYYNENVKSQINDFDKTLNFVYLDRFIVKNNEIYEMYEDENQQNKKKFEYYFIQFFKKY
jgi:choline kinase